MKFLGSIAALILAACLLCAFGQLPMGGVTFQASAAGNTWTTSTGWSATGVTSGTLNCTPACPSVTVPATVAGDLLVIIAVSAGTGGTYQPASINAGGTLAAGPPANCLSGRTNTGSIACNYALSETGAVTSIAVTMGQTNSSVVLNFRSYHPSSTTAVAETIPAPTTACASGCTQTACGASGTKCNAPTATLAGTSDLIVSAVGTQNTGCATFSPFGNFSAPGGDGVADRVNSSAGTGATFTQGTSCPTGANAEAVMVTVAFK